MLEVAAIKREYGTARGSCAGKHVGIVAAGFLRFLDGQDIMPQHTQTLDDPIAEVLIGVQTGHAGSSLCMEPDRVFDFVPMSMGVFPGGLQVRRR